MAFWHGVHCAYTPHTFDTVLGRSLYLTMGSIFGRSFKVGSSIVATRVGIGVSHTPDSFRSGEEAALACLNQMGGIRPDLLFVFGSIRFDQSLLLKGITSVTGSVPLVGCSTAGEILPDGPHRRSVVVMSIQSDAIRIATGVGLHLDADSRQAGRDAARQVLQMNLPSPHLLVMFPDGLHGNGAEVVRGIQDVLGLSFPIVGGSAADDFAFTKTYQYCGEHVYTNAVSVALLAGEMALGVGARHGWKPLGKPHRITRAFANVVQELDERTAVNLYEMYFGEGAHAWPTKSLADMSIVYPLGMPVPGEDEYLLRNVMRVDPQGALIYAGEIPEGAEVRLMIGTKEHALKAARLAADQALMAIAPRDPNFALVFSSCSRARLFGRRAVEEIVAVRRTLGEKVPFVGFYGYGEQAPLTATEFRGLSYFHNETIAVCAVATPA